MAGKGSALFKGAQPDITPAQIGALITFYGGQAVAFGLISNSKEQVLVSAGSIIIGAVWKIADAFLRGSRNKAKATH